jgi:isoquinoline 1-oxidoreductase
LSPENVRIIKPYVGGGFGGKSASRQAVEAAPLAKLTGKPVEVVWDRSEEFFYDTFRPAAVVKIPAGMSDPGKLTFWDFKVYGAGDRGAKQFYDIPEPAHRIVRRLGWRKSARSASLRGGSLAGSFGQYEHVRPRVAHRHPRRQAGVDPVEFRLRHLTDKRMRTTLQAAMEQFGWSRRAHPADAAWA